MTIETEIAALKDANNALTAAATTLVNDVPPAAASAAQIAAQAVIDAAQTSLDAKVTAADGSATAAATSASNAAATLAASVKTADIGTPATVAIGGYTAAEAQDTLDNAKTLQNYTALRAYTGRATGVRITTAGIAGTFQLDASDTTSADNGGTTIVDAAGRRWKRVYDGNVRAGWFDPNYSGDAWVACQAAIDAAAAAGVPKCVVFSSRTHNISKVLRVPQFVGLIGETVAGSIINKTTTTADTLGTIPARSGAVNDDYNVDSVISIVHPANDFARFNCIENLTISRDIVGTNSCCIFAPRFAYARFVNLVLSKATKGILSYVNFLSCVEDVVATGTSRGFSLENDGSNLGGSTSLRLQRFYANAMNSVVEPDVAIFLYGLSYSNLISCAADNHIRTDTTQARAYWLASCNGVNLSGCGVENIKGEVFRADSSKAITVSGMNAVGLTGAAFSGTVAARYINASTVTFVGCTFGAIASPGTIFNLVLQGGGHLTDINEGTAISGGNGFVGYGGSSTWSKLASGEWSTQSSSTVRKAVYSTQVSTDHGDADFTIAAGQGVSIDRWATPLTANRAAALSTTSAINGDTRRVVRTAAATGAFNLNVGTGPLKALSPGQWCDVSFDGTAWLLTAAGSL